MDAEDTLKMCQDNYKVVYESGKKANRLIEIELLSWNRLQNVTHFTTSNAAG